MDFSFFRLFFFQSIRNIRIHQNAKNPLYKVFPKKKPQREREDEERGRSMNGKVSTALQLWRNLLFSWDFLSYSFSEKHCKIISSARFKGNEVFYFSIHFRFQFLRYLNGNIVGFIAHPPVTASKCVFGVGVLTAMNWNVGEYICCVNLKWIQSEEGFSYP